MTTTAVEPTVGQFLVALGNAMIEVGQKMSEATVVADGAMKPLVRTKGKISHSHRMRMQERALGEVDARGGSMSRAAFATFATKMCGYGRGYAQFYAGGKEGDRLLMLTDDRKQVAITKRGEARLAYAREFLAEYDATSAA